MEARLPPIAARRHADSMVIARFVTLLGIASCAVWGASCAGATELGQCHARMIAQLGCCPYCDEQCSASAAQSESCVQQHEDASIGLVDEFDDADDEPPAVDEPAPRLD